MRPTAPRPRGPVATPPSRLRARRRALAGLLLAVTTVTLAGCGVRLETAAPTEPVPDAAEVARSAAVDDALALEAAAGAALTGTEGALADVLALAAAASVAQADALGGVYDSGLPDATPTPAASASAPAAATPHEVLALLGTSASDARTDARDAEDPGTARLLASVAASRAQLATRLASVLGADVPALDAEPEGAGLPRGGSADGSGSGDGSAAGPSATPSPSATGPGATDVPDAPGDDLDRATLLALVVAEDQAGYGFEVAAARLSDDERARARDAAAAHRSAATAWAVAAGVAGTTDDPRRVTYAIDGDMSSGDAVRAFCAGLLSDLADVHADAVLATTAGTSNRTAVVDGLRTSAVEQLTWGGTPTSLPGLPAQS